MSVNVIRCDNSTVTDFYLDIVNKACEGKDKEISIVARFRDAISEKKKGKFVIYWVQGIAAEEHYMRYHNKLKEWAIDYYVRKSLVMADFVFFVSEAMRIHFEKKYHLRFDSARYYIMPCFNAELNANAFFTNGKYRNNTFAYIGSMEAWQGIDHILDVYKKIENYNLPNTKLLLYTSEQDTAKEKVEKRDLKHVEIGYVDNSRINDVLSSVKYGFILREDNKVNRVATPTKISTYMANGVIPIYSKCIDSFHFEAKQMEYAVEEGNLEKKLLFFEDNGIAAESVLKEYSTLFNSYYSANYHIKNIRLKFDSIM